MLCHHLQIFYGRIDYFQRKFSQYQIILFLFNIIICYHNISLNSFMSQVNQTIFNNLKDFVTKQSEKIISTVLENRKYDPIYAKQLIDQICTQVIAKLSNTNRNFKYITNCILLAKGGNGLDLGGLCSWDAEMDGTVTIRWDNNQVFCILNVYGVSV